MAGDMRLSMRPMKWVGLILLCGLPLAAHAQNYESVFAFNRTVVQVQQETDNAVLWTQLHGYNDRVAYQFLRRCGWLRMVPEGHDWCGNSSAHRNLIDLAYQQGSRGTLRLLRQYRDLGLSQ